MHLHSYRGRSHPYQDGRAAEMRTRGMSYAAIAEELKVSAEAVRKRLLAATDRRHMYPVSPLEDGQWKRDSSVTYTWTLYDITNDPTPV